MKKQPRPEPNTDSPMEWASKNRYPPPELPLQQNEATSSIRFGTSAESTAYLSGVRLGGSFEKLEAAIHAMPDVPRKKAMKGKYEPARKNFKCNRHACGLAQTSHGRTEDGGFVCKDGKTGANFHQSRSDRLSVSMNHEQVLLLDEIRLIMQRGGDVRHLARRPGFAELAKCVARMRGRVGKAE